MRRLGLGIVILAAATLASPASRAAEGSARATRDLGLSVGLFSDQFPGLYGIAVGWNLSEWLQPHLGFGGLSGTATSGGTPIEFSTTAIGGGIKAFVPGWNFSPYYGFNFSKWSVSGTVELVGETINAGSSLSVIYSSLGFDWQTDGGFNLGFGAHILHSPNELTDAITVVPHLYVGWYFDILE